MKTPIVALLVLVVVSSGESLICKCGGYIRNCPGPVETCRPMETLCGNIRMSPSDSQFFSQGCMEPRECRGFNVPGSTTTCCTTDLCNARDGPLSNI